MYNSHRLQSNQSQHRMSRHVMLLLALIMVTFLYGMVTVYSSSAMVYEIQDLEENTMALAERLAQEEAQYHKETAQYANTSEEVMQDMVAYSSKDSSVRYAQVGGSVYSMLTDNRY